MKKLLFLTLALVIALVLVACGGGDVTEAPETDAPVTDAPETEAPHVHAFVDEITYATCAQTGRVVSKCECGEIGSDIISPTLPHTPSVAECEKDTVCTVCNAVIETAKGHDMQLKEVIVQATCSAGGKAKYACSVCGVETEKDTIAAAHKISADATWTISGDKYSSSAACEVCGKKEFKMAEAAFLLDFETPLSEVSYDGFKIVKPEDFPIADVVGGKVLNGNNGTEKYIDVEASKLQELGVYAISFDFVVNTARDEAQGGSIISLLEYYQDGGVVGGQSPSWSWYCKYDCKLNRIGMNNAKGDASLHKAGSYAEIEIGKTYNVTLVTNGEAGKAEVFVNGKSIGVAEKYAFVNDETKNENLSFRIGDNGMPLAYTIDNFVIAGLR